MVDSAERDPARCARAIVDRVGKDVRIAVPIGIGKPILLLNALYRLAESDPTIKLSIFTGLTLTRPNLKSTLEKRFVGPLLDRVLAGTIEPLYVAAQRADRLPSNIAIHEFFLQAGMWTGNGPVQRAYTSLNYSHVAQHLRAAGTNVFAQLVAPPHPGGDRVSLGSNTDVTLDMVDYIVARRKASLPIVVACEINPQMPYMQGDAEIPLSGYDFCLEPAEQPYALFSAPKQPVSLQDYAMALYAAALVRDGGTLQIGIGTFGDALTQALIVRHTRNDAFRDMLRRLGAPLPPDLDLAPFVEGLYGCTEMMVDGYLALMRAGILKRRVRDSMGRESVLDAGFFVGNADFYRQLRDMPDDERAQIRMSPISHTNTLSGDIAAKKAARVDARFINTAMTVTLLGAVASDATADGRVVSGVGGQLDLVLQAHELAGARSIIAVRGTRRSGWKTASNIVASYANCTVPRSLRDIVVSEYGIADVKGRSDRDTVAGIVAIADGQFQPQLIAAAHQAGKLERGFSLPKVRGGPNSSQHIEAALMPFQRDGLLRLFPLGTEMTELEQQLVRPLADLAAANVPKLARMFLRGLSQVGPQERPLLQRVFLDEPKSYADRAFRYLLLGAIRTRAHQA